MEMRQPIGGSCLMEEVQNGTIQMTFYQVRISLVPGFVFGEGRVGCFAQALEAYERRFHEFQAGFFREIETVPWVDNGTHDCWSLDFPWARSAMAGEKLRPR